MGAGWCKRYSKNNGTDSSFQDMLNQWVDKINCGNDENKWNWKWARRRQTKWKDRPEISSPRLINPCFLQGAKWDNVILSVPDPEMKSRIPVAPPRRKRKRRLGTDHAPVYQTLSFPDFRHRCFDLGTDTSMSLSSLDPLGPRSPRTPRSPWTSRGPRRMSLDYSDCDCSISSRTSLASIPVTDELYRKHHFLSVSGQSFNMTQASMLNASTSSFKRNQHQKRRKTLQNITSKYNLTLSLPNLNHLFSKYNGRNKRELCAFSSLPDLLRPNEVTKEAVMYAMLYGIKSEYGGNFRSKTAPFARGTKPRLRKEGENQTLRKSGGFQVRSVSQLNVSRFSGNVTDTIQESNDAICEEEIFDGQNTPKNLQIDNKTSPKQNRNQLNVRQRSDLETATNDLNGGGERSLGYEEVNNVVPNTETSFSQQEPVLIEVQVHEVPTSPVLAKSLSSTVNNGLDSQSKAEEELDSHRMVDSKVRQPYDNANKENFDSNLLLKYRNLSKFKSPRYLKTFRRLSQRQTEKVGCPLFFDKHHACSCLRPRGQRFQSMSALPSERPSKFSLKNGLIKKSLSVNHSQQGRKMDRVFKSSLCVSHDDCCSHKDDKIHDKNNNGGYVTGEIQNKGNTGINGLIQNGEIDCTVGSEIRNKGNSGLTQNGEVDRSVRSNVNDCTYVANKTKQNEKNDCGTLIKGNRENGCIYIANEMIESQNCVTSVSEKQNGGNGCVIINGVVNGLVQNEPIKNNGLNSKDLKKSSAPEKFDQNLDHRNFNSTKIPINFSVTKNETDFIKTNSNCTKIPIFDDKSVLRLQNEPENGHTEWSYDPPVDQLKTIVKIGDVTLSRRSSTSDSLCELEDAIYDMLVVSSANQQTTEVKN